MIESGENSTSMHDAPLDDDESRGTPYNRPVEHTDNQLGNVDPNLQMHRENHVI